MDRIGRGRVGLVTALMTAAVVLAGPLAAQAEPQPGTVTATFTDLCGFVQADFTNADPNIPDGTAFIRFSRNGKLLDSFGEQINGGQSATLYQVAASGDVIRYEWDVAGGTTESLEYTHVTPPGCDEPRLSLSLIDSCGPEFTIVIENAGTAPVDVVLRAPTLQNVPYTVAAGGVIKATVPGVAVSGATLSRHRPVPVDPGFSDLVLVDFALRAPGCGIPWPNDTIAAFTPSCDKVAIVLYALDMKGLVHVYRNGKVVYQQTVDLDIYKFSVAVKRNDVVTIDNPPQASYTHHLPAGCPVAAPPPPTKAAKNVKASPSPAPAILIVPSPSASPVASPESPSYAQPAEPVAQPPTTQASTPVAAVTAGAAITLLVFGFGGWFLIAALRRRRQPVWAVAFATRSPRPAVRDIGFIPTTSVRWIAHPGPRTHTLREDTA
jgi:hypothetical protein